MARPRSPTSCICYMGTTYCGSTCLCRNGCGPKTPTRSQFIRIILPRESILRLYWDCTGVECTPFFRSSADSRFHHADPGQHAVGLSTDNCSHSRADLNTKWLLKEWGCRKETKTTYRNRTVSKRELELHLHHRLLQPDTRQTWHIAGKEEPISERKQVSRGTRFLVVRYYNRMLHVDHVGSKILQRRRP